jgi:hypothetical protein
MKCLPFVRGPFLSFINSNSDAKAHRENENAFT